MLNISLVEQRPGKGREKNGKGPEKGRKRPEMAHRVTLAGVLPPSFYDELCFWSLTVLRGGWRRNLGARTSNRQFYGAKFPEFSTRDRITWVAVALKPASYGPYHPASQFLQLLERFLQNSFCLAKPLRIVGR